MGLLIVIAAVLAEEDEEPAPSEPPAPATVEERQRAPSDAPAAEPAPEEPPTPPLHVRGSASGPWAYGQAGLHVGVSTFANPQLYGDTNFDSFIAGGWGFERGGIRIVPSAGFNWNARVVSPAGQPNTVSWSPLRLRVAAPDVFEERWLTGIRLMPVFGLTVPTGATPLLTTLSLGLRLSRRFGPIELAYRADAGRSFFSPPPTGAVVLTRNEVWQLVNSFFAEAWFAPWVSAAIGFALRSGWLESPLPNDVTPPAGGPPTYTVQRDAYDSTIQVNFVLHPLVGLSVSMDTVMSTRNSTGQANVFPFFGVHATSLAVRVWFRSDALMQRNWLDR